MDDYLYDSDYLDAVVGEDYGRRTPSPRECPCEDGVPNPCTLCGASAEGICGLNLDGTVTRFVDPVRDEMIRRFAAGWKVMLRERHDVAPTTWYRDTADGLEYEPMTDSEVAIYERTVTLYQRIAGVHDE